VAADAGAGGLTPTTRQVWRAVLLLHRQGHERVGPKRVADAVADAGGPRLQTTQVTGHLKKLAAVGRVERLPQGHRRALYRVVEPI
jgi:hypothetical protein